MVNTQVLPVLRLNAAPGLRSNRNCSHPGMTVTATLGVSEVITAALLAWSITMTAAATAARVTRNLGDEGMDGSG